MIPSYENILLNNTEYATNDVTHGKNIAVLNKDLNFKLDSLSMEANNKAIKIIIGTWNIKNVKVFFRAVWNTVSENNL